jgi:hypothetical protein
MRWPATQLDRDQAVALKALHGASVNCLLIPWNAAAEKPQQVEAFASQAHAIGLAAFALLSPGMDPAGQAAAVRKVGLDGIVELGERQSAPVIIAAGLAPRVRAMSEDTATATPTSEPWIDSNTWLVRALRAGDGRPVWIDFTLDSPATEDYLRAFADAAVAGGRWVFSPTATLLSDLSRKKPQAQAAWDRIAAWLRFFEDHSEWRGYSPSGPLGIVYEPAGDNVEIVSEILNLVARRRIPYRVILRASLRPEALAGLRAVVAAGLAAPAASEIKLLKDYVMEGGLLIGGPAWAPAPAGAGDYFAQESGKGRTVTFRDDPPDPDDLARGLPSLIGRNNLGIRLFNGPSVLCFISSDAPGVRMLVQLINYASAPSQAVTVRVSGDWRTAKLYVPDSQPVAIPLESSAGSVQATLPSIPVYAALLLEK